MHPWESRTRARRDVSLVRLPVAGLDVVVRTPTGSEDLLLLEAGPPGFGVALAFLRRVVTRLDGEAIEWERIAVTDIDVLLLKLRQRVLGDRVRADLRCPAPGCHSRVDIAFSVEEYIDHHRPRPPARVRAAGEAGWFRLDESDVEFRVPRAGDQVVIALESRPELALRLRCIRPPEIAPSMRRRVEAAMEAMAPSLCSELHGTCPECGALVSCLFDPLQYVLRELRDQAAFVHEDVCALARTAHWSEAEILALPTVRRLRYVELMHHEAATF